MADELNGLLRLTEAHIKPAAETAAKAFNNYPLSVYIVPDASKRLKKQAVSFGNLISSGILYGEVYATSLEMEGVAVWFPPDDWQQPPLRRPIVARLVSSLLTDKELLKRSRAFMEYAKAVRKRVLPARHWYLQLLGVAPDFQGMGYSSMLLKPMLARADREGLPCYLETQAEMNVALYEHFGFKVAEQGVIPGSNVKSWAMVRDGGKGELKNQNFPTAVGVPYEFNESGQNHNSKIKDRRSK